MKLLNGIIAGSLAIFAVAPLAQPADTTRNWRFDVLLDGKEIGYHAFELRDDGSQQVLETEASFDVKFLFINAFRYRHSNVEIWSDGCLEKIDATTNSNGKQQTVSGRRADERFAVRRTEGESSLPVCVQSFAYWNPRILDATRLLNTQTGEYENVSASFDRRDEVRVDGEPVDALRYRLSTKGGDITLWYSDDDQPLWLALEAPAKGGRTLRYEPTRVPDTQDQSASSTQSPDSRPLISS